MMGMATGRMNTPEERKIEQLEKECAALRAELDSISAAIGTCEFMDPPDGGSVALHEQVKRMRSELDALKSQMPAEWGDLPEDRAERDQFNKMLNIVADGDVRYAIAHALKIWSVTMPNGSFAKQCRIMANEVAKLYTRPISVQGVLDDVTRDAVRYRLLRLGRHWSVIDGVGRDLRAEALDAAVDVALAAAPKPEVR